MRHVSFYSVSDERHAGFYRYGKGEKLSKPGNKHLCDWRWRIQVWRRLQTGLLRCIEACIFFCAILSFSLPLLFLKLHYCSPQVLFMCVYSLTNINRLPKQFTSKPNCAKGAAKSRSASQPRPQPKPTIMNWPAAIQPYHYTTDWAWVWRLHGHRVQRPSVRAWAVV